MLEGLPKYANREKRVLSPLEKINQSVNEISKVMELSDEDYEILRKYANILYRTREIRTQFSSEIVTKATHKFGHDKKGKALEITITKDNQLLWLDRLNRQIIHLREDFFNNNQVLELARRQVLVIVQDVTCKK